MGIIKIGSVWFREEGEGLWAFLDFRGERQALPHGSSPLMGFGGRIIDGQFWTADEVKEYLATLGWREEQVCVFEYTRTELPAYYRQQVSRSS